MAQHTPGPWQAADWFHGDDGMRHEITASRNGLRVGFWDHSPGLGYAADANLRLIAAAPDLLAALRQIEAWHTDLAWDEPKAALRAVVRIARAAIAKAERDT